MLMEAFGAIVINYNKNFDIIFIGLLTIFFVLSFSQQNISKNSF